MRSWSASVTLSSLCPSLWAISAYWHEMRFLAGRDKLSQADSQSWHNTVHQPVSRRSRKTRKLLNQQETVVQIIDYCRHSIRCIQYQKSKNTRARKVPCHLFPGQTDCCASSRISSQKTVAITIVSVERVCYPIVFSKFCPKTQSFRPNSSN